MTRRTTTTLLTLGAGLALACTGGCADKVLSIPVGSVPGFIGYAGVGAGAMTVSLNHGRFGPRVTVHNESAAPVAMRLWVGKVDSREPMGVSDIRTNDDLAMLVEPGTCVVRRAEKRAWPTSVMDAVIWVSIVPETDAQDVRWIALERGGPFDLVIVDGVTGQTIDVERSSAFTDLPSDRRIVGREGEHPVWNSPDGAG